MSIEPRRQTRPGTITSALPGKTNWRMVEIGRGSSDHTCLVVPHDTLIKFGRIASGGRRRIFRDNKTADVARLSDKPVAHLVKQMALVAGIRPDPPEANTNCCFPDVRCVPEPSLMENNKHSNKFWKLAHDRTIACDMLDFRQ